MYMKARRNQLIMLVVSVFIAVVFFIPKNAEAACVYNNPAPAFTESDSRSTATAGDTLHYVGMVTRSGDMVDCNKDNISISFEMKQKSGQWVSMQSNYVTFSSGTAVGTYVLNLSAFDRSVLYETNKVEVRMVVRNIGTFTSSVVATTNSWVVNISGTGGSTGALSTSVYFKPAQSYFDKNQNDSVQILVSVDGNQLKNLDPSIKNVYLKFWVNDKQVGTLTKSVGDLISSQYLNSMPVSVANGFKDGVNIVKVEIWNAGTSEKISTGTATLNATGLGTTEATTGSTNTNSGTAGTSNNTGNKTTTGTGTQSGTNITGGSSTTNAVGDLPGVKDFTIQGLVRLVTAITCYVIQIILAVMILALIIAGVRFLMAKGKPEAVTTARKNFTWVLVGIAVIISVNIIIATITNFLGAENYPYAPLDCSGVSTEITYPSVVNP